MTRTGGKRAPPSPWRFKRRGAPGGSLHPEAVAEAGVGVGRRPDGLQALQVLGAVGLGRALLLLLAFEEVEVNGPRHVRGEVAAELPEVAVDGHPGVPVGSDRDQLEEELTAAAVIDGRRRCVRPDGAT